jgi:hypothetical protein
LKSYIFQVVTTTRLVEVGPHGFLVGRVIFVGLFKVSFHVLRNLMLVTIILIAPVLLTRLIQVIIVIAAIPTVIMPESFPLTTTFTLAYLPFAKTGGGTSCSATCCLIYTEV